MRTVGNNSDDEKPELTAKHSNVTWMSKWSNGTIHETVIRDRGGGRGRREKVPNKLDCIKNQDQRIMANDRIDYTPNYLETSCFWDSLGSDSTIKAWDKMRKLSVMRKVNGRKWVMCQTGLVQEKYKNTKILSWKGEMQGKAWEKKGRSKFIRWWGRRRKKTIWGGWVKKMKWRS